MSDRKTRYTITVKPSDDSARSSVVMANGEMWKDIKNDEYVTLGRANLKLIGSFKNTFQKARELKTDISIGAGNIDMSRSCLKIGRTAEGLVQVLECGATNVTSVEVEEMNPDGKVAATANLDLGTGMTKLIQDQSMHLSALESM